MDEIVTRFHDIGSLTRSEQLISVVDVLLVAYLLYRLLMLIKGTRMSRVALGVAGFLFVYWISGKLGLATLNWLLEKAIYLGPAALVILFLPELRTAVEGFARPSSTLFQLLVPTHAEERVDAETIEQIVAAVAEMAAGRVGALIVIERSASLDEFISNGVTLNAKVSVPLLGSIFFENNPLHDGAVIVRGDSVLAAACRLPLSEARHLDPTVHMRHRAAVGITETFDCISVVVSEERGTISVAMEGRLRRLANHVELRKLLNKELRNIDDEKTDPTPRKVLERRRKSGVTQ